MEIDGVFSGGGIKGYALVGAYEVLEANGFSFKRLAGTSAGAIIAAFVAAGYTSKEILKIMEETQIKEFLDHRMSLLPFPIAKMAIVILANGHVSGTCAREMACEKNG